MRKKIKENLLEIFKSLFEAHNVIKEYMDDEKYDNAVSLLGECQDTALQLGGIIENSEGEDFVTISFIGDYCKSLYEVAANISKYDGDGARAYIDESLITAESSAKNHIKVKLEVVFMPYKASMWDSLESVWKAADEDPDCDAYVVPVPYYDRNPDHSFDERHYEGDDFPEYVPVVHYNKYNLRQRHPDVIYIHNPYDDCNYVTSVDPRFYSGELKKYTDKLVYIPYFVVSDMVPDHFCTLPACVNSDHIIVQSDQVRTTYIENYVKTFGNSNNNAEYKILSLGSPKFDAVAAAQNRSCKLPDKWKQIIGNKRVILYNTSIGALLNGNEDYLNKIISVLNYFSLHRDVVLWWRPHPLSSAAYSSMRSHILNSYLELVEWYKRAGFGIFDDSSDLHRAIACSDSYYGDRSSLVALYQLTGKPILLQNIRITDYESAKINIGFEDVYDDGEYLWFSAINFNGLFKMKKTDTVPVLVGFFPDEPIDGKRLFSGITECNGKLYFSPLSASSIAVYDPITGLFDKIGISREFVILNSCKIYSAVTKDHRIYFIPYAYNAIICYDTEEKKVSYYTDWVKLVQKDPDCEDYYYFRKGVFADGIIYLPMICTSGLMIFDTVSEKFSLLREGFGNAQFHSVLKKGKKLYLSPFRGNCCVYDIEDHSVECLPVSNDLSTFSDICDCGDDFLIFPYSADSVVAVSKIDGSIHKKDHSFLDDLMPDQMNDYDGKYIFAKRIDDKIYAYSVEYSRLVVFDINTSEWSVQEIAADMRDCCEFVKRVQSLFARVSESCSRADETNYPEDLITIPDLCNYLKAESKSSDNLSVIESRAFVRRKSLSNPDGTAGIKIHETIKKMVLIK
ncbi:MAG: hypothetical protein ACI4JB_10570 [Porcipelethomonas sp.]